jgi:hypothetical protein
MDWIVDDKDGEASMGPLSGEFPRMKKVAFILWEFRIERSWGVYTEGPSSNVRAMVLGVVHVERIVPVFELELLMLWVEEKSRRRRTDGQVSALMQVRGCDWSSNL